MTPILLNANPMKSAMEFVDIAPRQADVHLGECCSMLRDVDFRYFHFDNMDVTGRISFNPGRAMFWLCYDVARALSFCLPGNKYSAPLGHWYQVSVCELKLPERLRGRLDGWLWLDDKQCFTSHQRDLYAAAMRKAVL